MRIVVAGAGLGGLTAALALARAGCHVDLVERAPVLGEAGAGVQLSPPATQVLRALGIGTPIEEAATRPDHVRIRRWRTGGSIARVPMGALAARRYGAPFLLAHRADVQAALLTAVLAEPAIALSLGSELAGFATTAAGVAVELRTGGRTRRIEADGLVGADGLRSVVRAQLVPDPADAPAFSGRLAWRGLVPAPSAPAEARLPVSQLWLGPHAHLVHYPVRGGTLVNVVAIVDRGGPAEAAIEGWSAPGDPAVLLGRFAGWAAPARALLAAAPGWRVWPLFERPPLERWSRGPVTLLGDAAHPMLPFLAQGAAQAICDGWALGQAVATASGFADAARRYEAARRPTATRVQRESSRQGSVYHFGSPLAAARDAVMGLLGPDRMLARYDWLYGRPGGL